MTPEQVRLVQESMARLATDPDAFSSAFYARLFEFDPESRALFPADLAALQHKFFEQLALIVASITDLPALLERTRVHGANHRSYGVRSGHYVAAGQAFLYAVRAALGDAADDATLDAWRTAWDVVAEAMQAGALHDSATA